MHSTHALPIKGNQMQAVVVVGEAFNGTPQNKTQNVQDQNLKPTPLL